jgi:hypothetical protein
LGFGEGQWQVRTTFSLRKVKIKLCKKFKRGNNNAKKNFKKKNYFSIFLTFGFWGGSMAGENVQFEESQDNFV